MADRSSQVRIEPTQRGVVTVTERRGQQRAAIRVPLRVSIPSIDAALTSEAVNISHAGMFIAMDERPPIGTDLDLEVSVASGSLILHATAEVVRHEVHRPPHGIGVRFLNVSYEASALIERMLSDQQLFGKYRLEALIGSGGMAEVYRAKALDGRLAGRTVALKRMRRDVAGQALLARLFRQESRVAEILRHPNIVEVYEIGAVGDVGYIAMEHVAGCNLAVIIDQCASRNIFMPIDFCCYVAQCVAAALDYAHGARDDDGEPLGLIHRDVAPSNIFISDVGEIKLGDFGVSFVNSVAAAAGEQVRVAGKEPYMAPEAQRDSRLTPAADLFSLGAVLYEMSTNRAVFGAAPGKSIRRRVLAGDYVAPGTLRPDLPEPVAAFLRRALSPRLADGSVASWRARVRGIFGAAEPPRFATAAEFGAALLPLYDPAIGTQMAIAAVVRNLLRCAPR